MKWQPDDEGRNLKGIIRQERDMIRATNRRSNYTVQNLQGVRTLFREVVAK